MIISTFISNIPKWEEFSYIFEKIAPNTYKATHKETNEVVVINENDGNISEELFTQLELFKRTPEEGLGEKIPTATINQLDDALVYQYEILLAGVVRARMIANGKNPDTANLEYLFNWLEETNFFTSPASGQYHEAYPRGLVQHTLKVYNKICDMWKIEEFSKVAVHSAALIALVHDWCKIGLYEEYLKNVKDEVTGQWHKESAYRRTVHNTICTFGHGVSSMYLASKFFKMTTEESLAIRWHMGEYNVCDYEMDELHHSNETYPIVHMIQFADRLATASYCM